MSNAWDFLPFEYYIQQINFRKNLEHSGNRVLQSFAFGLFHLKSVKLPKGAQYLTLNKAHSLQNGLKLSLIVLVTKSLPFNM